MTVIAMSSKTHPFTRHDQVVGYVEQYRTLAKANGLDTQNHRIYINTALMRRYMSPTEEPLKTWMTANTTAVSCVIRGRVHKLVIDYFNPADHQDFLNDLDEYLADVLQIAFSAAKRAQAKAEEAVRAVQHAPWNLVDADGDCQECLLDGDGESDETPLLAGLGENSLFRRRKGFLS